MDIGEPLSEGVIDIHDLLHIFFNYHSEVDELKEGVKKALTKFQLLLVNSIQSIYQSQGVNISTKHIEIIVRQMTSKVLIKESGDTPLRLSRIRTDIPILGISGSVTTVGKMSLYRGVTPLLIKTTEIPNKHVTFEVLSRLRAQGVIKEGDVVLVTKGDKLGNKGGTNTLKIVTVQRED